MSNPKGIYFGAVSIITIALILTAAGCSNLPEKELTYRKTFKKIWDKAMTDTEAAKKKIDQAYSAGDVASASTEYAKLGLIYAKVREEIRKAKAPEGYANIQILAVAYFNQGASYYATTARVVSDSGGNYNAAQEAELKAAEKKWKAATTDLEKALKAKKIELK
jgi:hypothetical protein